MTDDLLIPATMHSVPVIGFIGLRMWQEEPLDFGDSATVPCVSTRWYRAKDQIAFRIDDQSAASIVRVSGYVICVPLAMFDWYPKDGEIVVTERLHPEIPNSRERSLSKVIRKDASDEDEYDLLQLNHTSKRTGNFETPLIPTHLVIGTYQILI